MPAVFDLIGSEISNESSGCPGIPAGWNGRKTREWHDAGRCRASPSATARALSPSSVSARVSPGRQVRSSTWKFFVERSEAKHLRAHGGEILHRVRGTGGLPAIHRSSCVGEVICKGTLLPELARCRPSCWPFICPISVEAASRNADAADRELQTGCRHRGGRRTFVVAASKSGVVPK